MSCGTATVSTNVAGLADLPTVQCEPTAEALAACMADAWERRQEIARSQQETVRATFTLDRWRAAWLEVLAEVT